MARKSTKREIDEDVYTPEEKPKKVSAVKAKKPSKSSTKSSGTKKEVHFDPPSNWEEELHLIEKMREKRDAPVDSLGSEALPQGDKNDKNYRYQCLISVMLSSQTKDEITAQSVKKLQEYGLTPEHIVQSQPSVLEELIKPAGFYRRKADYLIRTSQILLDKYDGDVPKTIEELVALPGVGYKMGYIALKNAWNICDGIGVDVHVHDICNRLQWTESKNPDETRLQLQSWLPKKYWDSINLLLVGFGQQICSSPSPKCQDCLLNKLCPSASRSAKRTRIDKKRKDTKESESSEDIEDLVLESDSEDSEELDNFSKHIDKLKRSK